ncbi:MAG: hypothetical protein FJ161_00025 [Gammaproteobacteria bacterium]|nr:hypothetical protein [Gammaproteobacteria bacterium]
MDFKSLTNSPLSIRVDCFDENHQKIKTSYNKVLRQLNAVKVSFCYEQPSQIIKFETVFKDYQNLLLTFAQVMNHPIPATVLEANSSIDLSIERIKYDLQFSSSREINQSNMSELDELSENLEKSFTEFSAYFSTLQESLEIELEKEVFQDFWNNASAKPMIFNRDCSNSDLKKSALKK